MFHKILRPFLRKMGVDLIRHSPDRRFAPLLRARWLHDMHATLALDVGANVGDYGHELRDHGYTGQIVSLEPTPSTFARLQARAKNDPAWKAVNAAAGPANARMKFNISPNTVSSSLLPMHEHHKTASPDSIYVAQEDVDVITLDSLLGNTIKPADRVWLKMDAQGYEFSILQGAQKLLPQVVGIECEISVVQLYEGTPLIDDAIKQIKNLGFRLVMIDELFWDPHTKYALAVDGIFIRENT